MNDRLFLFVCLAAMGAAWGITQPLGKIVVSGEYRHIGVIFWQMLIGALVMGTLQIARRRSIRIDRKALGIYLIIALIGTLLPNTASYEALRLLPAGLVSILLSLIPIIAFPMALAFGNEEFAWARFLGLILGCVGVLLIVAPEASLPERAMIVFIPIALIAPIFYGLEGNVVARWGTDGLDGIDVLFGASVVGAAIALPASILTNTFIDPRPPWSVPDLALLLSSVAHVAAYSTYVWMVGRAGAVFAVQVSYLVTGFGVIWAMLLLGERFSIWIWAAMAVILSGVFLVQPRSRDSLAVPTHSRQTRPK